MPIRNSLIVDLTGRKFGRLTAVRREFRQLKRRQSGWICTCECGRERWVSTTNLVQGKTVSCGVCVKQIPGAAFRETLRNYKQGAKKRGYDFLLTDDECRQLFSQECFYCGAKPANIATAHWMHNPEIFIYQGIDRLNNEIGYVKNNCVSCCYICNKAKGDRTAGNFIAHCTSVSQRQTR